ncbi:unnamed protein product [Urochloa humidicola]
MKKTRGGAMGLSTVLNVLCCFLGMIAILGIMPLRYPGHLPEGATPAVDEREVRAAAARLMKASCAVWLLAHVEAPGKAVIFWSVGALAYAAYRAWAVATILNLWVGHVHGPMATYYRLAAAAAPIVLLRVFH